MSGIPTSNREWLLKYMKDSIGEKDPIEYFSRMTDLLGLLFSQIDQLQNDVELLKKQASLAIHWDADIASNMMVEQINKLRIERDIYENEIDQFKKAFADNLVTQNYADFCRFWQDVLGWHPFLDQP